MLICAPFCCVMLLQAGPGQPPDVWAQLMGRCAIHSHCQQDITCSLAQLLAEQQATNLHQKQELADLRQHNARLQEQVTRLQEQRAGQQQAQAQQQQHNAELQEQVASQGMQLRALHAQVQGLLLQRH